MEAPFRHEIPCHLCKRTALHDISAYRAFRRITSDCRLWPAGGALAVCRACGAVQKPATAAWRDECRSIYASYVVYRQGSGCEQAVFASSGGGEARSRLLLRKLMENFSLSDTGWHLDFGCGDGSLLRNAAAALPAWRRAGAELNDSRRPEIESIPGVVEFHAGNPAAIRRRFDLITAVHVVEHFEDPAAILAMLAGKLADGGRLVIEVPDLATSPFDLLIADHAVHFTTAGLGRTLAKAGLVADHLADDWVARELSAVARVAAPVNHDTETGGAENDWRAALEQVERHLDWLTALRGAAQTAAARKPIGIFGTSIAATWLAAHMMDDIAFFVDEDLQRVGDRYLERPVLHPQQVPAGVPVFIAHTPSFAEKIAGRLAAYGNVTVIAPP